MINCTIPMQKYSSLSGLYSESLELGLGESLSHKETVRLDLLVWRGGGARSGHSHAKGGTYDRSPN